jgi:hypothetical protein
MRSDTDTQEISAMGTRTQNLPAVGLRTSANLFAAGGSVQGKRYLAQCGQPNQCERQSTEGQSRGRIIQLSEAKCAI